MTAKKQKPTRKSRHDFKAVSVALKHGRDSAEIAHLAEMSEEHKIGESTYLRRLLELDRRKRAK